MVYRGGDPGGTGGHVPPSIFVGGDRPPGKYEKVHKNNVQQILTKDCNTLLGFGGPKSAAFRQIKMQKSSGSGAMLPRIISFKMYN